MAGVRSRFLHLVAALAVAAALGGAARAEERALEVGFGHRSLVTEERGVTLGGYGGRGLIAAMGVHDATFAKAIVVRTPERTLAIVTVDLIGVQKTILAALRARPFPERVRIAPEDVLVAASHTHAGYGSLAKATGAPLLDGLFFVTCGPFDQRFFDELVEKIRGAVADAWDDLAPASIGVGSEAVPGLSRNRGRSGGPVDPEVGVVKVVGAGGAVRGLLVNFAAHPVILGADNFYLSAEFPGAMQRALEARFPGATVLFSQGAEGDVSPRVPDGDYGDDDFAKVEATGRRLAEHVARIAAGVRAAPAMRVSARILECDMPPPAAPRDWVRYLGGAKKSVFQQIVLGDTLLMAIPGEPCCRIGLDLKAAARRQGFAHAFVVGLANDHCGYFVHAEDYAPGREKSHEYEKSLNFYGPEIGDFFVKVHEGIFDPRPLGARRVGGF